MSAGETSGMTLWYPGPEGQPPEQGYLVESLTPADVTAAIVPHILAVQQAAYLKQFSEDTGFVYAIPAKAVTWEYEYRDPENNSRSAAVIERRISRMRAAMNSGSRYMVLRYAADPEDDTIAGGQTGKAHGLTVDDGLPAVRGLVKVSPSKASRRQKLGLQTPNVFVNDVFVHPDSQGKGVGAALLHAALKYGGYEQHRGAAMHAFAGSKVNEWFKNIGFKIAEGNQPPEPVTIGGYELPQELRVSETGLTIRGIVRRLERRHGWLAQARQYTNA